MTREEAIAKADSGWWEDLTPKKIVEFQLYEEKQCMEFSAFRRAIELVLGRLVWTHEFADPDSLKREFETGMNEHSTNPLDSIQRIMKGN